VVLLLMLPLTSVYAQAVGSDRSAITKSVDAWQIGSFEIGPGKCTHPDPDDMRPYTLCLAETVHDETERLLQRQFKITLKNLAPRRVRVLRCACRTSSRDGIGTDADCAPAKHP
jgi:hypothetical protein